MAKTNNTHVTEEEMKALHEFWEDGNDLALLHYGEDVIDSYKDGYKNGMLKALGAGAGIGIVGVLLYKAGKKLWVKRKTKQFEKAIETSENILNILEEE